MRAELGREVMPDSPTWWDPAETYQEGTALQSYHDVRELGERGGAQADVGHVSLQLQAKSEQCAHTENKQASKASQVRLA